MGAFTVRVELRVGDDLREVRWLGGERWTFSAGDEQVTLCCGEEGYPAPLEITKGIATITVVPDLPPERHALAPLRDWPLLGLHGMSAVAFVLCALVLVAIPIHPSDLRIGPKVAARLKVTVDPQPDRSKARPRLRVAPIGAYAPLPSHGVKPIDREPRKPSEGSRTQLEPPAVRRGRRASIGPRAPSLGEPALAGSSEFEKLVGRDSIFGAEARAVLDGLGSAPSEPWAGNGGAYGVGLGRGGGGTGEGTIGLGNLGTIGHGGGHGGGYGRVGPGTGGLGRRYGSGRGVIAEHHHAGTVCTLPYCGLHVTQCLDKEIIRRVVRQHLSEVRYCYEKALAKDPALEGRVLIRFTVGEDGHVSASELRESSLPDSQVGQCVADAIERWVFPRGACRGLVTVSYPFVFKPSDQE
jgi:TonB family protein